jgi:hypothetical protein
MYNERKKLFYLVLFKEIFLKPLCKIVYLLFIHDKILAFMGIVINFYRIASQIMNCISRMILYTLLWNIISLVVFLQFLINSIQGLFDADSHFAGDIDIDIIGNFSF